MIPLNKRINAFVSLGEILLNIGNKADLNNPDSGNVSRLEKEVNDSVYSNGWFIEKNVRFMISSIGSSLTHDNLLKWTAPYSFNKTNNSKTVGVVMAGNIPLVGFHDFLSVLISGNCILAKLSSDDNKLLPIISDILIDIEPEFKSLISFTSGQLKNIDAIIATGSNNTSRYFEYYFGKYPNIIRKNRNSIAIITGNETEDELVNLANDIFIYYGLGCRNISHIIIPQNYDFTILLQSIASNKEVVKNHKYFNNYEYNKAIYLVNGIKHFDTENLLITEDLSYSTPVSVLSYEYYIDINEVSQLIKNTKDKIQCVVSTSNQIEDAIKPGNSQSPLLWDYADGVDTLKFLTNL